MKIKHVIEGLKDSKDNPCWKGYKPVGTKQKGGKTVPNCVPTESIEESASPSVEEFFQKVAQGGDYDMLYDAQMGKYGKEVERAVQDMYDNVSINSRLHPDDNFEEIFDIMLDMIEDDYGSVDEEAATTGKITDLKPGQSATIQTAPGVSTTVDLKANPTALAKDETGKLKLVTTPPAGTASTNEPELPKAGDEVKIGESLSALRKLSGL